MEGTGRGGVEAGGAGMQAEVVAEGQMGKQGAGSSGDRHWIMQAAGAQVVEGQVAGDKMQGGKGQRSDYLMPHYLPPHYLGPTAACPTAVVGGQN